MEALKILQTIGMLVGALNRRAGLAVLRGCLAAADGLSRWTCSSYASDHADFERLMVLYLERAGWASVEPVLRRADAAGWLTRRQYYVWSWVYLYWINERFEEAAAAVGLLREISERKLLSDAALIWTKPGATPNLVYVATPIGMHGPMGSETIYREALFAELLLQWCDRQSYAGCSRLVSESRGDRNPWFPGTVALNRGVAEALGMTAPEITQLEEQVESRVDQCIALGREAC